jgi:adenine phosphoribosyltransferase
MSQVSIQDIKNSIRDIPDFPKKGILFKDLTTAFKDPKILFSISERIYQNYRNAGITKVVGIESRGFIAGSIVAEKLNAGFVPIRKPGKLPAETYNYEYDLEYGTDTIEIHKDALDTNDIILLHDDLLATGGTAAAAIKLIRKFIVKKVYVNFIVELSFLNGRQSLGKDIDIFTLIKF